MTDHEHDTEFLVEHLVGCARCHGDGHDLLWFRKLRYPAEVKAANDTVDDVVFSHWATCPTTGEPILMAWIDLVDGKMGNA